MKKKKIILMIIILIILNICGFAYCKYILTRSFNVSINTIPFYFETEMSSENLTLTDSKATGTLKIKNYKDSQYNEFTTNYEIIIENNNKFDFSVNNENATNLKIEKSILGGEKIDENLNLVFTPKKDSDISLTENLTLKIKSTKPYSKEISYNITIKSTVDNSLKVGTFVEYNVAYTDFSSRKDYTTKNGWRYFGKDSSGRDMLISTGMLAQLNIRTVNEASWYEPTDSTRLSEFKQILGGDDYTFYQGTADYRALRYSAGLYYDFETLPMIYNNNSSDNNLIMYIMIKNNNTVYDSTDTTTRTAGEIIKTRNDIKIRLITLPEVNKTLNRTDIDSVTSFNDTTGVLRLDKISSLKGMEEYSYTTGGYVIASPYPSTGFRNHVTWCNYNGMLFEGESFGSGIRPLIILPVGTQIVDPDDDGVYELIFN